MVLTLEMLLAHKADVNVVAKVCGLLKPLMYLYFV